MTHHDKTGETLVEMDEVLALHSADDLAANALWDAFHDLPAIPRDRAAELNRIDAAAQTTIEALTR